MNDWPVTQRAHEPAPSRSDEQQRYFDGYESYRAPSHPVVEAFVLPKIGLIKRYVDLTRARLLLDVGCGNGVFTEYLRRECRCVGLDASWQMLHRGAPTLSVQGDALALPFSADSFDVAFCANLLHHLDDIQAQAALCEMKRVSRSWVVVVEPNAANPPMWLFGLLRRAERGTLRFSQAYLRHGLEAAGLDVVFIGSTGMITQNLTPRWMVRALRALDRITPFGAYTVAVARVPS